MYVRHLLKKLSGATLIFCFSAFLSAHPVFAETENTGTLPVSSDSPVEQATAVPEEDPDSQAEPPQVLEGLVEDENGSLHFYEQGQMITNTFKEIEGNYYYFGEDGTAAKSIFISLGEEKYYFDENGTAATGWKTIADKTYYFQETGVMLTGLKKIDGKKYYFSKKTGAAYKGLKKINGKVFYFGRKYRAITGWKTLHGKKYFFKKNGVRTSGWTKIDGETYYFRTNGVRASGWTKIDGEKHYFKTNGVPASGLKRIDSALYFLKTSGEPYRNKKKTVDGKSYYFGSDGKAKLNGWIQIGAANYYANDRGTLRYYWQKRGATWVLYHADGKEMYASNLLHQTWNRVQALSSATSYFIAVDTHACRVMIFQGSKGNWVPIQFWLCSPGKPSTPTVRGFYTVSGKGYSFGRGFTCYYYTQFHGNYLFHSILYYQGTLRQKDGRLGMRLSHGCVRLRIDHAKWIYSKIPRGTKVYTF